MPLRLGRLDALAPQQRRTWAAARVWTARQAPYLASAILAVEPIVVEQLPPDPPQLDLRALPTDPAWHVYLDPEVLDGTAVPELGFWLLHQVTHLLRHHAERYPERGTDTAFSPLSNSPLSTRDPQQCRWNTAADAEINDDLHTDALHVPADATTPVGLGLPEGWLAEQYWDRIAAPPPDPHDCGTGCDGQPRPWNCGRPGLSPTGRKLLSRDVANRIREHNRKRGEVPAGWQRWADEELDPVVDWRQVLRSAVRRGVADVTGRVDFTYRRPSRRAAALPDVILPSLRRPRPTVAVVVDTSGSMSDPMLAQVLGEIAGLLSSLGVGRDRLHIVCCDAQAYEAQRVFNAREVRLLGGGGTDMGAGLDATAALRPRPDLVVVLTDGHTPWPIRPPARSKVLVGLLDPTGSVPDWATRVLIDPAGLAGVR
jgi:predicted metal-dependent peptidase